MTKNELREYAAANHERLKKQDVALGDVVKILVGPFAGKEGVVRGIYAFDDDFANPCYKVDIVPDKYKCRKKQLTTNSIMGGLSAYEFEVMGNRAPNNEPERDPDIHVKDGDDNHISLKATIEADKPKPKLNVGDKVVTTDCSRLYGKGWRGEIVRIVRNYATVRFNNRYYNIMLENLAPDTEQTAEKDEHPLNKRIRDITAILSKENENYKRMAEQIANSNGLKPINYDVNVSTSEGKEENDTSAAAVERGIKLSEEVCRKMLDGTVDMEKYRMELAAKIAVAYAEKDRYEPQEIAAQAVEVANGLKRARYERTKCTSMGMRRWCSLLPRSVYHWD